MNNIWKVTLVTITIDGPCLGGLWFKCIVSGNENCCCGLRHMHTSNERVWPNIIKNLNTNINDDYIYMDSAYVVCDSSSMFKSAFVDFCHLTSSQTLFEGNTFPTIALINRKRPPVTSATSVSALSLNWTWDIYTHILGCTTLGHVTLRHTTNRHTICHHNNTFLIEIFYQHKIH